MELIYENGVSLSEFNNILNHKSITSLYQPIVSLATGEILGYEALSRGPKNTIYYNPQNLFKVAKENGLLWDLELLCRMKAIENVAGRLNGKKLFINIDPDILQDKKFKRGFTKELLAKYMINPDDIIFEITENTAIKDYKLLKSALDNYSNQGYKIALDDTGSGYSGLILLAETQPNYVKVDMELIRDIDKSKFKQDLIKTFQEFSKLTNIKIIAEGIETESELQTLINLGVEYGQGYLIQKPDENIKPIDNKIINLIKQLYIKRKLIENGELDDFIIGFVSRKDKPIDINTNLSDVNEIFSSKYSLQGIPVVNNGKAVGLVMRNKFYYQLLKRNIKDLSKVTVEKIMTKLPLIVEYNAPIKKVAKMAMSRREECSYDYIIVTKDNRYYGVVPILTLLESLTKY